MHGGKLRVKAGLISPGGIAMSCAEIMSRDPVFIRESESIGAGARKIVEHCYINLPVVDAQGKFVGLFGIYDLLALLVPRVAVIGNLLPNLRFMGEDVGDLRKTFAEIKDRPVRHAVNREAARVHPDTPLAEAIRLFCHNHTTLPVVERDSGKLAGMISYWDTAKLILRDA
jgi:CBS-domain-containing membrane protein